MAPPKKSNRTPRTSPEHARPNVGTRRGRSGKRHNFDRRTRAEMRPEILQIINAVVSVGAGKLDAARKAGIDRTTLEMYEVIGSAALARARKREEEGESSTIVLSPREQLFAAWFEEYEAAHANLKAYLLDVLRRATEKTKVRVTKREGDKVTSWEKDQLGDPKVAQWLLERLYPKEFAERFMLKAEHSGSIRTRLDFSKLSTDELFQLKALRKKIEVEEGAERDEGADGERKGEG